MFEKLKLSAVLIIEHDCGSRSNIVLFVAYYSNGLSLGQAFIKRISVDLISNLLFLRIHQTKMK